MSKLIRISELAFEKLNKLEADMGAPKQRIIEKALNKLERENFIKQGNEGYALLRKDPEAWNEELKEREEWDVTLGDGLEDL